VGSVQFNLVEKSPLTLNRQKTECNAWMYAVLLQLTT
jgi:hypothetical protein